MSPELVVAFVASGVALLVGLLGPVVASRTTRQTLEAQRKVALDERLWQRRADTYVDLLHWAGQTRALGGAPEDLANPHELKATAKSLVIPLHLDARLTAYASGAVYAAAR